MKFEIEGNLILMAKAPFVGAMLDKFFPARVEDHDRMRRSVWIEPGCFITELFDEDDTVCIGFVTDEDAAKAAMELGDRPSTVLTELPRNEHEECAILLLYAIVNTDRQISVRDFPRDTVVPRD